MSNYNERRGLKPMYTGIPLEVLRRIGDTYREGFFNYDEQNTWERYYQTGLTPEDFLEVFNNAIEHLYKAYDEIVNGKVHDGNEDQLAHAVVNLCMIMWATENGKLPNKMQSLIVNDEQMEVIEEEPAPAVDVQQEVKRNIFDILRLKKAGN
jgi:hypothetical protein